jgi:hypothetical protein
MTILTTELILHPSENVAQGLTHGGEMNKSVVLTNAAQGMPPIDEEMRLNGRSGVNALHNKVFYNIETASNGIAIDTYTAFISNFVSDQVVFSLIKGTATDVWGDVYTDDKYGLGYLAQDLTISQSISYNAGTNETTVIFDSLGAAYNHFRVGDRLLFTQRNPFLGVNDVDPIGYRFVSNPTTSVTYASDRVTAVFPGSVPYTYFRSRTIPIQNQQTGESENVTVPTRICSVIDYGDVECTFNVSNNTSSHGTYDAAELLGRNVGAIQQVVTITFDTASTFSAVSSVAGVTLTSGTRSSTWEPLDGNGDAYLAVPSTFWTNDGSGDWVAGDTIQIETIPAIVPFYIICEIPAGVNITGFNPAEMATTDIGTGSTSVPVYVITGDVTNNP